MSDSTQLNLPGYPPSMNGHDQSPALHWVPTSGGAGPIANPSLDVPLEEVYQRYAPYVAAIASRILGRVSEVQDVVQDVFATAVHGLRRRDDPKQIKSWLATVTVRRATRQLRTRSVRRLFDPCQVSDYELLADQTAGPEERQLVAEVYRALDKVPARQRVPWVLRNIEGESLQDVADLCGCSLATAKRRVAAAHTTILRHMRRGE